jgi:hypothetical protein
MIRKDAEGSGRAIISRYYPGICLEGLRKTTKNQSGKPISEPRFECKTFRIKIRSF